MGHDVAGRTRVAVPVPGTPHFWSLVEDAKIIDAFVQQTLAHANAGKTGANDKCIQDRGLRYGQVRAHSDGSIMQGSLNNMLKNLCFKPWLPNLLPSTFDAVE
jgi:hypothetical protein